MNRDFCNFATIWGAPRGAFPGYSIHFKPFGLVGWLVGKRNNYSKNLSFRITQILMVRKVLKNVHFSYVHDLQNDHFSFFVWGTLRAVFIWQSKSATSSRI